MIRWSNLTIGFAVVALVLASFSAPAPAAAQQDPAPEIAESFAESFVSAVRVWDVERWAELVTEDVVMMAPSGRVVEGRDAFRELWSRTFEGRTGVNPLQVEIRGSIVEGDLAVVRADYGPEGRDPVGQYVWTLVRSDEGDWKLEWWIFNRKPADA